MNLYTINKHWRVVETVEVFAESEAEALEQAKDAHSNNQDWIEIMDACVTDTKECKRPLKELIEEAEEYLSQHVGTIDFSPWIAADWNNHFDEDCRMNTCAVDGAFYDGYEIQATYEDNGYNNEQPLCNFTEADQYRICEEILKHKDE